MKHILLIEDNQDHAELIQRSLNLGMGPVKIHLAHKINDAFRILEQKEIDLILSDYYLPDTKGEAHIRKLSQNAPDTPIIIITGQGDEKTAARSIKAGADDYIVKTRGSLNALPKILNRTFAKHQKNLRNKQDEIKKHLQKQKEAFNKVLKEVDKIEKKMKRLKKLSVPDKKSKKKSQIPTLESLTDQVDALKDFIQKMFKSGK